MWWDRRQPEPNRQIIRAFLFGGLAASLLILINVPLTDYLKKNLWDHPILLIFILSFLVDALIEEGGKLFCFRITIFRFDSFDEVVDGMIYGFILGLGFAFMENVFYALALGNISLASGILLLRGLTATLMHFIAGGIIGYYFALNKFKSKLKQRKFLIFKGLIIAILFHGSYNVLARMNQGSSLWLLTILLIVIFILMYKKIIYLRRLDTDLIRLLRRRRS